jgi:hypothetical protein
LKKRVFVDYRNNSCAYKYNNKVIADKKRKLKTMFFADIQIEEEETCRATKV